MKHIVMFLVMACLGWSAQAAPSAPLRVGILPTLSTKVLLTNYQPLRVYLA
ncbi:MAG TPA: hypothetical protein VIN38_03790 [Thiobacillus sp.]